MNLLKKIYRYLLVIIIKKFILKTKISNKKKFNLIFKFNYWGDKSSLSGTGSSPQKTRNVVSNIRVIIDKFEIKNILDVPCGDFVWMKEITDNNDKLNYLGGDIVDHLVNNLNLKYKTKNVKFENIDIINNQLPKADLLICRDCFIHFSNKNILKTLNNFLNSDIKYFLITDSVVEKNFENIDINTGEFRGLDLTIHPFNLPKKNLYTFYDVFNDKQNRYESKMTLWHRDQFANLRLKV